jgi:hypothetical protein
MQREHDCSEGDLHDPAAIGIATPAVSGKPSPFHIANMWSDRPGPAPEARVLARRRGRPRTVAARPSASIRLPVTTVVASTRTLDRPVALAAAGSRVATCLWHHPSC